MSGIKRAWAYGLLGVVLLAIDRISKYSAVRWCTQRCSINPYLSFDVVYNRGTSWGLFHSHSDFFFGLVTLGVMAITGVLLAYTIVRFRAGYVIVGEAMVIAGSVSNIIDRFFYQGVIDFIELSYHGWFWPSFNGADVFIVLGVILMLIEQYSS